MHAFLLAHSGLRIETLGNYEGMDGLRIKDLPEMKIEKGNKEQTSEEKYYCQRCGEEISEEDELDEELFF